MTWRAPEFSEIKMDAEISAYQDDFDPTRDPEFVSSRAKLESQDDHQGDARTVR
jgi:hypothetical protein